MSVKLFLEEGLVFDGVFGAGVRRDVLAGVGGGFVLEEGADFLSEVLADFPARCAEPLLLEVFFKTGLAHASSSVT